MVSSRYRRAFFQSLLCQPLRELVRDQGISIWLKADLDVLLKRVAKRNDRPLLQQDDPAAVLKRLIDVRYPVYSLADITVESRDVQHTQMVNEVIKALAAWPGLGAMADDD